jgi:NADPH-dependent 2,4-dienoyl-CoA reductase/sulfur reductase-like enzyme
LLPGAATVDERQELARKLESLGIVAISVSGGVYETGYHIIPPMMLPHGVNVENAARIKEAVNIPVYAAGRINDPRMAEKALIEGKIDLVAFARPFMADREFLAKAKQGKFNEIRKCIACNHCIDAIFGQKRIECTVNPAIGDALKGEVAFEKASKRIASKSKKVIVVGGGPGGMEAAKIAKERGHNVTLFEKSSVLGGNLIPAAAVSFKEEINRLREYQVNEVQRTKIKLELGTETSTEEVLSTKPDVVILATGSVSIVPDIPGISKYSNKVTTAVDVLKGNGKLGKSAVVVGGGMIGCEAAVWLTEHGHDVTLVTRRSTEFALGKGLAADWGALCRLWLLVVKWPALGIKVVSLAQYNEVTEEGLVTVNQKWQHKTYPADNIVFALGFKPYNPLFESLQNKVPEVYLIGDCKAPRKILDAIQEATVCAQSI